MGHADHAEEVCFELAAPVLHAQVFNGAGVDKAGVVDQHVDVARLLVDSGDCLLHGAVIADIHFQRFERELFFFRNCIELRALFRRTSGSEDAVAVLGEQQSRGLP